MNLHNKSYSTTRHRPGFTMIELLVVVAVIAVLVTIAVPNLSVLVPRAQLRYAGIDAVSAMQSARLKAANSRKPVRVVLDCRDHVADPATNLCLIRLDVADFFATGADAGTFEQWTRVPGSLEEIAVSVDINASAGTTPVPNNPADVFWAVFLPSGMVQPSHAPFNLTFSSNRNTGINSTQLSLNNLTGRVALEVLP